LKIRFAGHPLPDGRVAVGRVGKAHGIKGEVKIHLFFAGQWDVARYPAVVLQDEIGGDERAFKLRSGREQGGSVVVALAGIADRNGAEALRDRLVVVAAEALPPLAAGETYWHELTGIAVRTADGREVGHLRELLNTAAHPILVIGGAGGREYLVPARPEFLAGRDDADGALIIDPPPGLLELNGAF